jgi:hypothetical protein
VGLCIIILIIRSRLITFPRDFSFFFFHPPRYIYHIQPGY